MPRILDSLRIFDQLRFLRRAGDLRVTRDRYGFRASRSASRHARDCGQPPFGGKNTDEVIANYTLANSQFIGQLDRLNDDPLLIEYPNS